ncbi:hypothetical protein AAC387_Pa04g1956 [Persea americana]
MERWETMDDESLLVSVMRLAVTVGIKRSERAEAKAAEWVAEKEKLQKALEAKDGLLKEAASKNASLAADLEHAHVELGQLREEAKEGAIQSATLAADLDKAQAERIWDRAWELGWKAALRKVGVPGDDPAFRYPPKFPSSGSVLLSIVDPPSASGPSSEAPLAASVVPEACQAISEATPTDPEAVLLEAGAPQGWLVLLPSWGWCCHRAQGSWHCCRAVAGAITKLRTASTVTEPRLVLSPSLRKLALLPSCNWYCHQAKDGWHCYRAGAGAITKPKEAGTPAQL